MIDIDRIKQLTPLDGDVFLLPAHTSEETAQQFAEALHIAKPGIKAFVAIGELEQLSEAEMNAAGWSRS